MHPAAGVVHLDLRSRHRYIQSFGCLFLWLFIVAVQMALLLRRYRGSSHRSVGGWTQSGLGNEGKDSVVGSGSSAGIWPCSRNFRSPQAKVPDPSSGLSPITPSTTRISTTQYRIHEQLILGTGSL